MPKKSLSPTTKPKVNPEVYQLFNQRKGRDGTKRGWDTEVNWYKNLPKMTTKQECTNSLDIPKTQ